jgi:predicted acylesterase/phospholipase RssA
MFAAYQAGAWKVLAARLRPDVVIGASAGALNAWAIAGGAGPEELAAAWLDEAVAEMSRLRLPPRPGRCLFCERELHQRIGRFGRRGARRSKSA